ncbi:apolipoprotein A-I-like protein [Lates japonicus]|uniref:Apolipoprotein A-I-like protein n=1 Tax=Lates japonicus TaxID=270547 RepID=A0AAD3N7I6_LATJO|nr:apolipoprotein A-I-like protein [Lates japonicus]
MAGVSNNSVTLAGVDEACGGGSSDTPLSSRSHWFSASAPAHKNSPPSHPPAEEDGGGVRSTSTETHSSHTSPSSPILIPSIKSLLCAEVVQSRQELHQTTIMKFVALALALLLAVGSHAASLQADAPSQLAHIRSAMDVYLTQVKESAQRALAQLDDTEYRELKAALTQRLDEMHNNIKALQAQVSPVTDNIVATISDATADLRTSIVNDIEVLKTEIEPMRANLRDVVNKHIEEYRAQMEPIINEYYAKHTAEMDALRTKLEPVVEELRTKVATNVEETKTALMPIVESVRAKLSERLEALKAMATPYVEEYKEQLKQAYGQAQNINAEDLKSLREKIAPLAEEVKLKLQAIFETIAATVTKN